MNIKKEIDSIISGDSTAMNWLEVFFCYPSFYAVILYRMNHYLWNTMGLRLIPRFFSQLVRLITSIEIYPSAKIGKNFFIDHAVKKTPSKKTNLKKVNNNMWGYNDLFR